MPYQSAIYEPISSLLTLPQAKGVPSLPKMEAPAKKRPRVRMFGVVARSLSPHDERLISTFAEQVIVVVLALTQRPLSILHAKRLLQLLFC